MSEFWSRWLFGTDPIAAIQQWVGLGHESVFEWISLLGGTWGVLLVLGVAMWCWGREAVYALMGAIALGALTKEAMSMIFSVSRPHGPGIVVYENLEIGSFPSGHVYQILIPWGVLYVRGRVSLAVPALVAALVGFSRIYLGVHFLADVLFAFIFGALFVWVYYDYLWPPLRGWLARRSMSFYALLGALSVTGVIASMVFRLNNARRWEILGLVVGLGIALFAARRLLPESAWPARRSRQMQQVAVGLAGMVALLLVDQLVGAGWPFAVQGLLFCAATLWVLLAVPVAFRRPARSSVAGGSSASTSSE